MVVDSDGKCINVIMATVYSRVQSSVNIIVFRWLLHLGRSFMYNKNKRGPNVEP